MDGLAAPADVCVWCSGETSVECFVDFLVLVLVMVMVVVIFAEGCADREERRR